MFAGADLERVRDEWGHYLADLKPVEIERGLDRLASRVFPPTLGEFRLWCRPCLDSEWAFHHARKCLLQRDKGEIGDWSHPAVWRAAATMSLEVRAGDFTKVKRRWEIELDDELKKGWGEMPPPPPLRLEDTRKVSNDSPAALEGRRRLRELQEQFRTEKEVRPLDESE